MEVQCNLNETNTVRLMISAQPPKYNWISFKKDFDVVRLCLLRCNVILSASMKYSFLVKFERITCIKAIFWPPFEVKI